MLEALEDRCLLTNGGPAALVADILPGSAGSNPAHYVVVNNTLYFAASDGVHGTELYRSDGTAAGTVLVKDINPGGDSNPTDLTPVGSTLYFRADDGARGQELWKTDGTAAGTVLVKDINPGSGASTPSSSQVKDMADINGTLFLSANDGVHGPELWKSDGTAAGTVLVKDMANGSGGAYPAELTNVNGVAFFSANDGKNGTELWKSDGTARGTVLVADVWPGKIYYSTGGFDGGSKGSGFYSVTASSSPQSLTNVNGTLFFVALDGQTTYGSFTAHVYKSDGTAKGTVRVSDVLAGTGVGSLSNANGTVFFRGAGGLWKSDGTAAGTVLVADFVSPYGDGVSVNGTVFFTGYDSHGDELWQSDGTTAGTVLVKDIDPGTDPYGNVNSSSPAGLTNVNGLLYFSADDGIHGRELWQSDGTAAGTALVQDINPGRAGSDPQNLVALNNKLYFSADDGVRGRELWDPPAVPPVVPFRGSGSGGFTDAGGGFFATGTATYLGAFTHYGTLVLTPTDAPFVFAVSGRTVYRAANGDLLYAVTNATLNVLTGSVTGTDTWDGGTGRFAGASGVVDLSGQLLPDGSVTFSLLGGIAS